MRSTTAPRAAARGRPGPRRRTGPGARTEACRLHIEAATGAPRVLHVVQSGDAGGVQRHVRDLVLGLPLAAAGVVAGSDGWLMASARGAEVPCRLADRLRRSLDPRTAMAASAQVGDAADALGASLVHAHGVFALLASRQAARRRPLVYTAHGLQWRDPAHRPWVRAASRWIHARAAPQVAAIVAVSSQDAADAESVGFARQRIHRIPNGVARSDAGHRGPRMRAPGTIVAGVATRLVEGKGLEALVQTAAAFGGLTLRVAGSGPLQPALEQLARQAGAGDRIQWLGWVDDMSGFYAGIDVYVTLSRKEGLPYSVLDAMAAGLPVVASDIPGHRDLVDEGRTGHLVALGAHEAEHTAIRLRGLATDHVLRTRQGDAARRHIGDRFSLDGMLAAHDRLYGLVAGAAPLHVGRPDRAAGGGAAWPQ